MAQDYVKAREWYEKAADKGDAGAMTNLGLLYDNGQGVAQDYVKAREWYEKAADKGDAGAMTASACFTKTVRAWRRTTSRRASGMKRPLTRANASAKGYLEKMSINEAAGAGRYTEALQLQEASAAKEEAAETNVRASPARRRRRRYSGMVRPVCTRIRKALTVSDRAHALLPDELTIETNRAHALMFLGRKKKLRRSTLPTRASLSRSRGKYGSASSPMTSRNSARRA